MANQMSATKGNLIAVRKSLGLAKLGFSLLDRKRNILIKEMVQMIDRAEKIQNTIDITYKKAYLMLQNANIDLGICEELSNTVPVEDSLQLSYRSVMGVEIPIVNIDRKKRDNIPFSMYNSSSNLDKAYVFFNKVKHLTADLAEIENSIYRLANSIKKTQKRANALKNVLIPRFESLEKGISLSLEEKEREEFSRLKFIKNKNNNK